MPDQNRITIIIDANGNAAIETVTGIEWRLRKFESEAKGIGQKIKDHWLALSASVVAAYGVVSKAGEFMQLGAKALQAEESFHVVAQSFDINANKMLSKMKEVGQGMIDDSSLMQKSVQGLMMGLNDKQIVDLLSASRDAARVWGQDVETTFDNLVTAVGGGVRAMGPLVRMGLVTKEQFELLNKALAAGVEDIDLYALVNANATIQMSRFSNGALDAREKAQRFHAEINELKETIGKGLLSALQYAYGGMQLVAVGALNVLGTIQLAAGKSEKAMIAFAAAKDIGLKASEKLFGGEQRKDDSVERAREAVEAQAELDKMNQKIRDAIGAKDAEKQAAQLAEAMAEWNNKIILLNPNLTDTEKGIMELWDAADKLKREFGDRAWISSGLIKGLETLGERGRVENIIKDWELEERINEKRNQDIIADWELENRINEKRNQDIIADWELTQRIGEAKKRQAQEEINYKLSLVDLQEQGHEISKTEATRERIALTQELIALDTEWLSDTTLTTEEYLKLQHDLTEERKKFLAFTEQMREREGTMWEGMIEGARRYGENSKTAFQNGIELMDTFSNASETAMGEFFDYASEGFMNFGTLAKSVLHEVYKELLKILIIKPLLNSLAGLFGGGVTDTGSGSFANFIPQYAGGGIANRPSIFAESGPEAAVPLPDGRRIPVELRGGGQPGNVNVLINIENQSSQPVNAIKGRTTFDGEKFVIGVMLKDLDSYGPYRQALQLLR